MIIRISPIPLLLLTLLCAAAFGQDNQPTQDLATSQEAVRQTVYLNPARMDGMIVARNFADIPAPVSGLNEQGTMLVHVRVDAGGRPTTVMPHVLKPLSQVSALEGCPRVIKDEQLFNYVRTAIGGWNFKPLVVDGEPVAYRGYITVIFWYGTFLETAPY